MLCAVKAADWLPFLADAADLADEISMRLFRSRDLHVEEKPDRSLVTDADLTVEEALRALVARRHPELGVFGEEHGEKQGESSTRLIIDPIDATANYARGCFSITMLWHLFSLLIFYEDPFFCCLLFFLFSIYCLYRTNAIFKPTNKPIFAIKNLSPSREQIFIKK